MQTSPQHRAQHCVNHEPLSPVVCGGHAKSLWILCLAGMLVLSGCGGGSSSSFSSSRTSGPIAGNWQFTMTSPPDNSFVGGLQGGFLLQKNGSVNGAVVYSISLPGSQTACSSGSAPVTGTIARQNVTLTAVAGTQTFALTGTLTQDGLTLTGTYTSTDGQGCGTAQTGLSWRATSVPALTGAIQGNFHSVASAAHLSDQDFPVTGFLTQGENIGASNATVTGTLSFQGYPCLDAASVNGQISGNSVILQIIAKDGLNAGQIGAPPGFQNPSPVVFDNSAPGGGYLLHGTNGYGVSTTKCPGGNLPGDIGNVCLALGGGTGCTQPILLSPSSITFTPSGEGSSGERSSFTAQTITITNVDPSGSTLTDMSLSFNPQAGNPSPFGLSDFNGLPNFIEQDTCADPPGSAFSLSWQQSCFVTVTFTPQQSCPWLPSTALGGAPPSQCPFPLKARLTVNSSKTADGDAAFAVPITGLGLSSIAPSTPELDFGSEAVGEASLPQLLTFTNQQGRFPIQILPALSEPCGEPGHIKTLPRPLVPGAVSGFQVLTGLIIPDGSTIDYLCDLDLVSAQPNFQISADSCSGRLLAALESCSLEVTFVPQPATSFIPALDYFLELNTLQCTSDTTSECEIDSGRFPVELKANTPSPLRMSPGADLDFGMQTKGQTSLPLTITLFNDPNDPNPGTVNFTGNLLTGDFLETDDCGASLAVGSSCTLTVTFTPTIVGFEQGSITITYAVGQTQTVYLRGTGCVNCELPPPGREKR